jgi:hypothetical protein
VIWYLKRKRDVVEDTIDVFKGIETKKYYEDLVIEHTELKESLDNVIDRLSNDFI